MKTGLNERHRDHNHQQNFILILNHLTFGTHVPSKSFINSQYSDVIWVVYKVNGEPVMR